MKFTLSWLKRHLETTATLGEICDKLTAIGLEVEEVVDRSAALKPFIVAEILEADTHPNADRLHVCKVNTGKEIIQVVCGAPNARKGLKTVLARPGDVIPTTGEALKKGVIRGVESQGMMCSAFELQISDEHNGIIELDPATEVGASFAEISGLSDPVIDINLTPNRGDCAGVYGVARDLAAAGLGALKPLDTTPVQGNGTQSIKVRFDFADEMKKSCPLFIGRRITGLENRPSPAWMQEELRAVGLRPISALVDVTNFMTLDLCRPLHVFDADKLKGDLRVGAAKGGEVFAALNDKSYTLEKGMTIISDETGVISLAGVMGGTTTAIDNNTTNVFLEAAAFSPTRTAETGRALQLTSDARYRFERGIDNAFALPASEIATRLIVEMCGTDKTIVEDVVIAGATAFETRTIIYNPKQCASLIGVDVSEDEQKTILEKLGFKVAPHGNKWALSVPSWRADVIESADITEEIMRIKGYDAIEAVSLPRPSVMTETAIDLQDRRAILAKRALAARGLNEAVTWSFMPHALAEAFGGGSAALRLLNPINTDLDCMRSSILPNLAQAAVRNAARGFADVALFEVGPTYRDATPEGQAIVATALRAGHTVLSWNEKARPVDVFDAKADALAVLEQLGAPVASLQVTADAPAWYHPGRSGCLRLGANVLATFGELHPSVAAQVGIEASVVGAEIFLAALAAPRATGTAKSLLKLDDLQRVTRDFAFVVERATPAEKLLKAVRGADKKLIVDAVVFDVYEGKGVEEGKKSVAVSVQLQPKDKTLTDEDLEVVAKQIEASAHKAVGAVLRG